MEGLKTAVCKSRACGQAVLPRSLTASRSPSYREASPETNADPGTLERDGKNTEDEALMPSHRRLRGLTPPRTENPDGTPPSLIYQKKKKNLSDTIIKPSGR